MYGAFLALGNAASRLDVSQIAAAWPSASAYDAVEPAAGITLLRFSPRHTMKSGPAFVWSRDRQLLVCVDGYVVTDGVGETGGLGAQLASLAETFRSRGVPDSLRYIAAGSYTMFVVDLSRNTCYVVGDQMGSLPIYLAKEDGGYAISTNPVALASVGLIDRAVDLTACAEWALIGYTVGDRYPLKGIRTLKTGKLFNWDIKSSRAVIGAVPDSIWATTLREEKPGVQQIADLFAQSCRRIAAIDQSPANLQSAGMDSRLILASWPKGCNPDCYTYGNPEAHEIGIARSIAHTRGSRWHHVWQDGDVVADYLERMFRVAGVIAWPDRYFAGVRIAQDGHRGTLDGLMGDVLLGGSFYTFDRRFSMAGRAARYFGHLLDQPISRLGLDRIADEMYDNIVQIKDISGLREYTTADFARMVMDEKTNIMADIHRELSECKPADDSLAVLWRNFLLRNRVPHMTTQQAVMCRASVNVYSPFANDRDFTRLLLGIKPRETAFARLYIKMYRELFPDFARLRWGTSMIPINRPAFNHKLSSILLSKHLYVPLATSRTYGKPVDPNSWGVWLQRNARMREFGISSLRSAGILDETNAEVAVAAIAAGTRHGNGKLFHFASIARWLAFSRDTVGGNIFQHAGTS
jgi:asparagine synthetase B (glutamine-hydrolysing)